MLWSLKTKKSQRKSDTIYLLLVYSPPCSKFRNKLAEFLVSTLGQLRTVHQDSRVIVAGDRNDMGIDLITTLDPTLKQVVRGYTNKLKTKLLDVVYTDCQDLLQEPSILPPMQVDEGKVGKDSDHCGVELLPRTNLAPAGRTVREKVTVRPYPESKQIDFGFMLVNESWNNLKDNMSSTEMVDSFVSLNNELVDKGFPSKEIQVGPGDLPYFTEELRQLKRQKLRAYTLHGGKSPQFTRLKIHFQEKLEKEAIKYRKKIENEVKEGKRGSGYKSIRKLGKRPGESWLQPEFSLPAYIEEGLSPQQSADRLADYFSAISQSVEPLDETKFPPALRQVIEEGRASIDKPVFTQHEVYRKILRVTKTKSSVHGDIPVVLLKRFSFEYAKPATIIYNKVIQTAAWPRHWVMEQAVAMSKQLVYLPG